MTPRVWKKIIPDVSNELHDYKFCLSVLSLNESLQMQSQTSYVIAKWVLEIPQQVLSLCSRTLILSVHIVTVTERLL